MLEECRCNNYSHSSHPHHTGNARYNFGQLALEETYKYWQTNFVCRGEMRVIHTEA